MPHEELVISEDDLHATRAAECEVKPAPYINLSDSFESVVNEIDDDKFYFPRRKNINIPNRNTIGKWSVSKLALDQADLAFVRCDYSNFPR